MYLYTAVTISNCRINNACANILQRVHSLLSKEQKVKAE